MDYLATKYLRPRKIPSTACSGCGLGQVHKKIVKAIDELGIEVPEVVWGTGIGCAGRQTFNTWNGDNFAGTHGRVYAIAAGLRIALPPDKKLILTVGDGDAFGIGFLNLLHCARRNVDMTVFVCDNLGYMSTGGQYGWTTPLGVKTDSSPYGTYEANFMQDGRDVLNILKEAGATFLARHTSLQGQEAVESMKKAIQNRGFSLVHTIYPCVTNFSDRALGTRKPMAMFNWIKERTFNLNDRVPEGQMAFRTGIYWDARNTRVEFSENLRAFTAEVQRRVR
ncbi:MAG: thiamine pyrophosphate-dependent enzyme [Desulfocucumaceae bacterium]